MLPTAPNHHHCSVELGSVGFSDQFLIGICSQVEYSSPRCCSSIDTSGVVVLHCPAVMLWWEMDDNIQTFESIHLPLVLMFWLVIIFSAMVNWFSLMYRTVLSPAWGFIHTFCLLASEIPAFSIPLRLLTRCEVTKTSMWAFMFLLLTWSGRKYQLLKNLQKFSDAPFFCISLLFANRLQPKETSGVKMRDNLFMDCR